VRKAEDGREKKSVNKKETGHWEEEKEKRKAKEKKGQRQEGREQRC